MRLYDSTISGNAYKVRLLLSHLAIPYERVEIDVLREPRDRRPAELMRRTPIGKVPVLELDDGRSLAESGAILWYLARGTPYLPSDPFEQAKVLQWMFFEQNNHEPAIAVARLWVTLQGVAEERREALAQRQEAGRAALAAMERHLRDHPFFAGTRYTIADIALFPYTLLAPEGGFDLEPCPSVRAWLRRVQEQPGYVPMSAGTA